MSANLENPAVATGLEKVSFHSIPKKGSAKECSNYHTSALIFREGNGNPLRYSWLENPMDRGAW